MKGNSMNNQKLLKMNMLINKSYECFSFTDFLKLAIFKLHELVIYDSGMFFCAISKDCSFFKPYIGGSIEDYYRKQSFTEREMYLAQAEEANAGKEAYVYKSIDLRKGIIQVANEPRGGFLKTQENFHIACIRIIYKDQFLGEIYLHRSKDKPDFDDEDMFVLRLLQPHISTVFNIIHTVAAVKFTEDSNQPGTKKGMCIFDRELSITGGNITGIEMLKISTVFGSSLLYHIKELCADILDDEPVKTKGYAMHRSSVLKTKDNDVRIDILVKSDEKTGRNLQFIIIMEHCNEDRISADYKFKFSSREAEIIDGLIQGKINTQLAKALNLSENTIKTHIKNIYKKTGTNNRTELTYVLMLNNK